MQRAVSILLVCDVKQVGSIDKALLRGLASVPSYTLL